MGDWAPEAEVLATLLFQRGAYRVDSIQRMRDSANKSTKPTNNPNRDGVRARPTWACVHEK